MTSAIQQRLIADAVAEARQDPEFGRALKRALDEVVPKRKVRRASAQIDPFDSYQRDGESGLRAALAVLEIDQLKDIIAQHQMDRSRLAMKWRSSQRLIDHIVTQTISRTHKGEAFLS